MAKPDKPDKPVDMEDEEAPTRMVKVRLPLALYAVIRAEASADYRTVGNYIELMLLRQYPGVVVLPQEPTEPA